MSQPQRYTANTTVATITTTVVETTSPRFGQVTFLTSARTSLYPSRRVVTHSFGLLMMSVVCSIDVLAGQEGLEPPTCGFGARCSTNCAIGLTVPQKPVK